MDGTLQRGNNVFGSAATFQFLDSTYDLQFRAPQQLPTTQLVVERGQSLELLAGDYGYIAVRDGGTLTLSAGETAVRGLSIDWGGTVSIADSGTSVLSVKDYVYWRGVPQDVASAKRFVLYYGGQNDLQIESGFRGTLVAPQASVRLGSAEHVGTFITKNLSTGPDSILRPASVNWRSLSNNSLGRASFSVVMNDGTPLATTLGLDPGEFVVTQSTDRGLAPLHELTGMAHFEGASCTKPFRLSILDQHTATITPSDACAGTRLGIVPMIDFAGSGTAWASSLNTPGLGLVRPSVTGEQWTIDRSNVEALPFSDWARFIDSSIGSGLFLSPRYGDISLLRPSRPQSSYADLFGVETAIDMIHGTGNILRDPSALTELIGLRDTIGSRPRVDLDTLVEILGRGGVDVVDWLSLPVPDDPRLASSCSAITPVSMEDADLRIPVRWATRVTRPNSTEVIAYYDTAGNNIRSFETATKLAVDMSYDIRHNLIAKQSRVGAEPVGTAECLLYNDRGLVTVEDRLGDAFDNERVCYGYADDRPELTVVTQVNSTDEFALEVSYDGAGNPSVMRDAMGRETTLDFDPGTSRLRSSTAPDGTVTHYEAYDERTGYAKRVRTVADNTERRVDREFDVFGHLTSIERNGWGPDETWTWEDRVRLNQHVLTHEDGQRIADFTYDPGGRIETVDDGLLRASYSYTPDGRVQSVSVTSDEAGFQRQSCYEYDVQGQLETEISPLGLRTEIERSYSTGRMVEDVSFATQTTSLSGCATRPAGYDTVSIGDAGRIERDALGRIVKLKNSEGVSQSFDYDRFGRLREQVDAAGRRIVRRYDERGRLALVVDVIDDTELPNWPVSPEQLEIPEVLTFQVLSYDAAGDLVRAQSYARAQEAAPLQLVLDRSMVRDVEARQVRITEATEEGTREALQQYDGFGRLVGFQDDSGISESYDYSSPTSMSRTGPAPDGGLVTTQHRTTLLGEEREVLDATGMRLRYARFDEFGRNVWHETEDGSGVEIVYDHQSEVTLVRSLSSFQGEEFESTAYAYDTRGKLSATQSGARNVNEYEYDVLGRSVRTRSFPEPQAIERQFVGASDKLDIVTLPSGRQFVYSYDNPRGLLTSVFVDASNVSSLAGPFQARKTFVPNLRGDVVGATVGATSNVRHYDTLGRLTYDSSSLAPTLDSSVEYGTGGSVKSMGVGDFEVTRDANKDGRAAALHRGNDWFVDARYSGSGPPDTVFFGNGVSLSRDYDGRGRPTADRYGAVDFEYRSGDDGRRRLLVTTPAEGLPNVQMLALDSVGRVTGDLQYDGPFSIPAQGTLDNTSYSQLVGAAQSSQSFSYDTSNNITERSDSSGDVWSPSADAYNRYRVAPNNELIEYDEDGRVTYDGIHTITYNAWGLPGRIEGPSGECTYEYDAFNRRAAETCEGTTTIFAYFENTLVGMSTGGSNTAFFRAAGGLAPDFAVDLASRDVTYFIKTNDGSVRALVDEAGNVTDTYRYDAFGVTTHTGGSSLNRFGFQGQLRDPSGLYWFSSRHYSPALGRFLTRDPIGVAGGSNLYGFAVNRPNAFGDPFGLAPNGNPSTDTEPCLYYPCANPQALPLRFGQVQPRWLAQNGYYRLAEIASKGGGCTYCHVVKSFDTLEEADAAVDIQAYRQRSALGNLFAQGAQLYMAGVGLVQAGTPIAQSIAYSMRQNAALLRNVANVSMGGVPLAPKGGTVTPPPRQLPAGNPTTHTLRQVRNMSQPARWRRGEQWVQEAYGSSGQRYFPVSQEGGVTTPGGRFVDAPVDTPAGVVANEVKTYQQWRTVNGSPQQSTVPLSPQIEQQVLKDVWLRANTPGGYDPRWIFLDAPPGTDLGAFLQQHNIPVIIYW